MLSLVKISRRTLHKHSSLIASLILCFSVVLVFWIDSLKVFYIPENFSYSADLRGTNNYYDPVNERYSGERYSNITYSLQQTKQTGSTVYIQSVLDASTQGNIPVSNIARSYSIDIKNGRHTDDRGQKYNRGYLFAPRNLKKNQSFAYQHIAYDTPATMNYRGTEKLFGLEVYRYDTKYNGSGRVEEKDVINTGLPTTQGVEYAPHLTLWVEPVSGWLVKYEDNSTAYSFNRTTGERLQPLNRSSSIYTETSTKQHVAYARTIKYRLSFGTRTAPTILLVTIILLLLAAAMRKLSITSMPVQTTGGVVVLLALASLVSWPLHLGLLTTGLGGDTGLNPVAALCLILAVATSLCIYKRRHYAAATLAGGAILGISVLQILYNFGAIPFSIDLMLFSGAVLNSGGAAGRMSLFEAFVLCVLGVSLLKAIWGTSDLARQFAKIGAGLVVTLGISGLAAKILLLDEAFVVSFIASLSTSSCVLLILTGTVLLQILLSGNHQSAGTLGIVRALAKPAIITIPLVVIAVFAQLQQNHVKHQLRANFDQRANAIEADITSNVSIYTNTLASTKGLFAASVAVERDELQAYIEAIDLESNHPGIGGIGYAKIVSASDLPSFISRIQNQGYPSFKIFPEGNRKTYTPVTYVEPLNISNTKTLGYDLLNDPSLASTMTDARDSGSPSLSGKTTLIQDAQNGFLILLPIYKNNSPISNATERREALQGYVYGTFNATDFLSRIMDKQKNARIDVAIYDGLKTNTDSLLASYRARSEGYNPRLTRTDIVYINSRPWTIHYRTQPSFRLSTLDERMPNIILVGGSLLYLGGLAFYQIRLNRKQTALAKK